MDLTSGFVDINQCHWKYYEKRIEFNGYAFQIEMKFKARAFKYKIHEIYIIFKDRTKGDSKMNKSIIPEAIFGIIKMKIKSIFYKFW